ncbi:MAG TPA: thioredoxin domain-containing protein [Bryobacteraceae bacterium]|nr:thioredoxin domain-containing protein [Bryobacteraceae bacterium]
MTSVRIRNIAPFFLLGAICLAQGTWETATELPGVDWHGISPAHKQAVLKFIRAEKCMCGCNMKMAECRMKDPTCSYSRKEVNLAIKSFDEGKNADAVRAEIKKQAATPPPVLDDPVKISIAGDPYQGPENAKITIVEFSDFQCPFCSEAVAQAKAIVKNFPKDVKLVFKQFPLDSHAQAEFGAEAALAAQAQGKFWEMHDKLYAGFPDLSRRTVLRYAKEIGLDVNRFTAEVDSRKYKARVMAEEQEGEVAGVGGTPTFYINGKKYNGLFDVASITPLLKKELSR